MKTRSPVPNGKPLAKDTPAVKGAPFARREPLAKAAGRRGRAWRRVPRPPGASVELRHASGTEPDLLRHRAMLEAVCGVEFPYPEGRFAGRGVVICGGGVKYLPSVYVLVRLLRHLRCRLPVEVWHLGKEEMPEEMRGLLAELGAVCVDGLAMRRVHPARRLGGWELKCYALLHSRFAEVLLLDADNCPVRNPGFLFATPQYREHGAIFWPDYTRFARGQAVWVASGVKYDAASNLELTFRDGGTGGAGDPYTGLDRFGRLIETVWKKGTSDRVRSQYGRNRFGGIPWRRDDRAHALGVNTEDNFYTYDGLYQVKERQRGNLTGTAPNYTGITNLQQEEDWTYDATGNWAAYSDTSPANAQTRTHNAADELTRRAKGLQSEHKEGKPLKPGIDKLGMAKHEIEELHREGKHEQAEQMERKLAGTMHGKHEQGPKGGSPDRLAHVGQAIEHLRAAGLGADAEHLEQIAHRMKREMAHRGNESSGGKSGAEPMQGAMREMQEHMQQLSGQLQKMARGIEELREQVKDLRAQPAKKKGSEKTE